MSVLLMSEVWRLDLPATDKMVLLALADAANDDGVTWIAVQSRRAGKMDLLSKCSLGERAVQGALKRLCEAGYLARKDVVGKGVIWTVTPAANAPRTTCAPAAKDADPRSKCGETVNNHQPSSEAKASSEDGRAKSTDFDAFWEAYPAKVGKKAARRAWDRAKDRPPLVRLLEALDRYRRAKPADREWCHPATWLNEGRWDDVYGETATGPPPTSLNPAEIEARRQRLALIESQASV